jgi:microcystin degradation protein MlrC
MQESNTFSPLPTTIETFEAYTLLRGDEVLEGYGKAEVEVPAFLAVIERAGHTAVPLLAAYAAAQGPVTRQTFETLLGDIERRLRAAAPLDGLLLALHGALVVEDEDDAEGEIMERLRQVLDAGQPIAASLDLHGHITRRMLQPGCFFVGYREYPHIDMYETGVRTAELMCETLAGRRQPVMALAKRPLVVSAVVARTTDGPLAPVAAEARRLEASGEVLQASIFPVQPWLDVPDLGFAALVCADGDPARAERAASHLADLMWQRRHDFEPDLVDLDEAIRIGLEGPGLTVISDAGDAPTGGAAADSPAVLRALLEAGAERHAGLVLLTLCDPAAAARAHEAGQGAELALRLGHAFSAPDGDPVDIRGRVESLSHGTYVLTGAGARGMTLRLGASAVIAIGSLRLALRSRPSSEWDTGLFLSQGLDPRQATMVFVKSPSHFRAAYEAMAERIIVAATPGATQPDLRRVPYTRVSRPLHPLDDL